MNNSTAQHHVIPLDACRGREFVVSGPAINKISGDYCAMEEKPKKVTIYTDGACLGNPGPGGYGVVMLYDRHRKELSGGFRLTSNNRMELMAAIVGLGALKTRCRVTLYTDSQYLVNAMTKGWVERWRANGWMRNKRESALNPDLWEQLRQQCRRHEVEFVWVRGHADNSENNRCDELATGAAAGQNLPPDTGYRPPAAASADEGRQKSNNLLQ